MIIKEIKRHPFEFAVLFTILILGILSFFYFNFDHHYQRRIIYLTGGTYFLWSLFHHYRRGDLEFSLVVEYLLIALFATLLLSSTLL